jgi:anthranilate phosphoribosyltransferase
MIRDAIVKVAGGRDLGEAEAAQAMEELMTGEATPGQVGAFLTALRIKGESVDEIVGMARIMREKSLRVSAGDGLLDTCGTGGDGLGTFNVSTTAALVCAGAGVRVAKHGNRAATSQSGSADVLEALGAYLELSPQQVQACIDKAGFGFMFAQAFHPAMRFVAPVRREIGVRTIFNFLGPLTNPAGAQHQLLGVGDPTIAPKLVEALGRLGTRRALVVYSEEGLDEVSLSAPTQVHELHDGRIDAYKIEPQDAGLASTTLAQLRGGTAQENAERLRAIFGGAQGPDRDFVLINAGAALLAADRASDLKAGVQLAAQAIDSGAATRALDEFVAVSRSFAEAAT